MNMQEISMTNILSTVMLLSILFFPLSGLAENRPDGMPDYFNHSGSISNLERNTGRINVNDTDIFYTGKTVVYGPRGHVITVDRLHKGTRVGCVDHTDPAGHIVADSIWILPAGRLPIKLPGEE